MITFTKEARDIVLKRGGTITLRMENKNACYG